MNWKFHAIAISSICLVVLIVFYLTGQFNKPPAGEAAQLTYEHASDRFVLISKASWGLNCNRFIDMQNRRLKAQNATSAYPEPLIELVRENNVLLVVSEMCNGLEKCSIEANSDLLKSNPVPNCRKTLEVEYRCFSFDRPWRKTAEERGSIVIDCAEQKP